MIYLFIDESGDTGSPEIFVNSKDFSMACSVCYLENIEETSIKIEKFILRLKKKELKFSKMSSKESVLTKQFLKRIEIEHFSAYAKKTNYHHGEVFLKAVFKDLVANIIISEKEKIKVFIDGDENAYFRKIYEPIIKQKFSHAIVKFANSIKTPMIQVADFYAGCRRKERM